MNHPNAPLPPQAATPVAPQATPARLFDVSGTGSVSFLNLVRVELRKSYNTRAGFWLLFAIGAVIAILEGITLLVIILQENYSSFTDYTTNVFIVTLILVPMLPILLVTTEWSQRTAMVSFALEPRRMRVLAAKLVVSVIIALAAVVLMFAVAAACTAIADLIKPELTDWEVDTDYLFVGAPLSILATTVFGFAAATMLLNTPGAIVLFLLAWFASVPILGGIATLLPFFEDVVPWIALQFNVLALIDGLPTGAEEWGYLLVSFGFWIVLPLVLGMIRVRRAEVK